jgi:hypothetical protein
MIRLQIQDKEGKVIQDDELVLENGDILLCQVNGVLLPREQYQKVSKQLSEGFKIASKRANDDEIVPILYDSTLNFKILKIKQE